MNLVNIDKVKVKPRKSLVLKPFGIFDFINNITSHKLKIWLFIYHMFTTLGKIISKVNSQQLSPQIESEELSCCV